MTPLGWKWIKTLASYAQIWKLKPIVDENFNKSLHDQDSN